MSNDKPESTKDNPAGFDEAWRYPLMEAIFNRRSRRIGVGTEILGGPTAYQSDKTPIPLSELEEAILVQAATGISGFNLADLPFGDEQGRDACGNTMIQFTGRTWPSPCASHDTELFFWNDEGTYVMKLHEIEASRMREYETLDDRSRIIQFQRDNAVKLFDGRPDYPHSAPVMLPFNIPISDVPGSTMFLPIADNTFELINLFLLLCGDPNGGVTVVDQENDNKPAGCDRWIKEGLLNPLITVPLSYFGRVSLIESGFMIQNLLLAIQAVGLGGWVHGHAAAPILLGGTPISKGLGFRHITGTAGSMAGMPAPVGLDGILQSYTPSYFDNMDAAVDAVIDKKFGPKGIFNADGPAGSPFKNRREIVANVPRHSDELIQCVKDICNYIYDTYGRFPAHVDAISTPGCWVQAHHLDLEFYDKFYQDGAYTDAQKNHMGIWHSQ